MRRALPFLALVVALYVLAPRGFPATSEVRPTSAPAGGGSSAASLVTGVPSNVIAGGSGSRLPNLETGAPQPTGMLDAGGASYFKPTPRVVVSKGTGGWASFYDDGPGIYVALPGWTRDSPIRTVVVCANVGLWRCATANVWTSCGCHTNSDHPKIVDLSPDLMALITGWDRATMTNHGVVRVTLQLIGGD